MKQIDYIKIKVENVTEIDSTFLVNHPTIKNRYNIDFPKNSFHNKTLHGNNIDVYHNNNILYIDFSVPYVLYGHNYKSICINEVREIFIHLSELLCVNLFNGKIVIFEIGHIYDIQTSFKKVYNSLIGVRNMKLQKRDSNILIFGSKNIQFKLYNVQGNLKKKLGHDLFQSISFKTNTTVKVELKFKRDNRYTLEQLLSYGVRDAYLQLDSLMKDDINLVNSFYNYSGGKFDDVLYYTLHKIGILSKIDIDQMILDTINEMEIPHPKKTARRKSLHKKRLLKEKPNNITLLDLLEESGFKEPFSGPSHHQSIVSFKKS